MKLHLALVWKTEDHKRKYQEKKGGSQQKIEAKKDEETIEKEEKEEEEKKEEGNDGNENEENNQRTQEAESP